MRPAVRRFSFLTFATVLALGRLVTAQELPKAPPAEGVHDRWAVVIGVDAYSDPDLPRNVRAVSDANALERRLVNTMRWKADHVLMLVDGGNVLHGPAADAGRRFAPTRENLDWSIGEWLKARIKPGDLLVVYFAGHAVSLPDRIEDAPGTRHRDYLLPADARAADFDRTGWSLDAALDTLATRGVNPVICLLDTSTAGRGKGLPRLGEAAQDSQRLLKSLTRWPGVTAWIAGREKPLPEEGAPGQPGLFLTALFESLGTTASPSTLLSSLESLRNDQTLSRTGFAALGGVEPDWTLWGEVFARLVRPNGELVVQAGHADRVREIVVSADARWMATASMDSTVKMWSLGDSSLLRTLSGFGDGARSLALSGDGKRLAAGDGTGQVKFWNRQDTNPAFRSGPPPHSGPVEYVFFLPDGRSVVSVDLQDGKALLWDSSQAESAPRSLLNGPVVAAATASKRATIVIALADADGKVHLLRPEGSEARTLDRGKSRVTALIFSPDAKELAVGDEEGHVTRFEISSGKAIGSVFSGDQAVTWIRYRADGALLYRAGTKLGLNDQPKWGQLPSETGSLALSADGRQLALASDQINGRVTLYSLAEKGLLEQRLASPNTERGEATAIAFAPDGAALLCGEASGGVRVWSLPEGEPRFTVRPNRRRVAHLAASGDARSLLQISAPDGVADVWNLADAKVRSLPGTWSSGAFLNDSTLILTESTEAGGSPRLVDLLRGAPLATTFERPRNPSSGKPVNTVFDKLVVGPGGSWVAGGSMAGQAPLIAFWEVKSGKLLTVVREQGLSLSAIALSRDGKRFVATVDAHAYAYDIAAGAIRADRTQTLDLEAVDANNNLPALLAATFLEDGSGRVALGTEGGRVLLWTPTQNAVSRALTGTLAGPVRLLTCSSNGEFLGAAGDDRSLRVWPVRGDRPQSVLFDVVPSHSEKITSLLAWPGKALFVTGSEDTQTRFWSTDSRKLLGTLSLVTPRPIPAKAKIGLSDSPEWVCTTPAGLFDASHDGADHVRWTIGESVRTLEQIADKGYYVHRLTSMIAKGETPPAPLPPIDAPPAISLEWSKQLKPTDQDVELTIALGEPGLPDVRLYQGGVPIAVRDDFRATPDPRRWTTSVKLRSGINTFHVLAGRPNRVDGRSTTLSALFVGPDSPARLHILAIGVSDYQRKALQYADDDARSLADFLHQRGMALGGEPGIRAVLTDREVEPAAIDRNFRVIRDAVKKRPQDTVVVFIAGHTDVFEKRFCLLLPDYPFKADSPLIVASRAGDGRAADNPDAILPYAAIYTQLARLGALQRLVIVDACQAEAIKSDPQVDLIKRYMATDSRKAKTSYLLAARKGEAANEVSELKHGLLSYTVLRGLRADDLVVKVDPFKGTNLPADADANGDGTISTRELEFYVQEALPILTNRYNQLVQRGSEDPPLAPQEPAKLQNDDTSFPLLPLSLPARTTDK